MDFQTARPVQRYLFWRITLLMFFCMLGFSLLGCSGSKLDQDASKIEERRVEGQKMKMRELEDK